ncbi:ATP-binding response regulator [Vibrio sp. V39_P1S14PM300]|uniref:ATP-binding response regulator n=1 Tax=Vibrio sp. V39_P1S14PM300 TaxID=1938690 RepID=UPI0013734709|nr:hybrid sensor histidine kinase/response regulator [Vibrio sp. V39_P1S14PM300]NAX23127.1 response regulator [Vibrio sp. V39_P1S14PM300]
MDVIRKIYQYAEPNLSLVGWMGFIGFPIYYYVWGYVFPEAYESAGLRGFCALLLLGLALREHLPGYLKKYLPYYYVAVITICLPFFFSFMMFMNDWSTVWVMSFMASIFLHILLVHETKVMLMQAILSVFVAFLLSYFINDGRVDTIVVWPYVPIFLFTYIFGNLFYFRNQVEHETKVSIAKSFGAGIAHEMRNPLSALRTSVDVLETLIPNRKADPKTIYELSEAEVERVHEVLRSADEVIKNGNETIDLLLTSIDQNRVSRSTFIKHSIEKVVRESLDSFTYSNSNVSDNVKLVVEQDFDYFGSDTLMKYALYNLLKNAFFYQKDSDFEVIITITSANGVNQLRFYDNGAGIEPDKLDHIFKDFYTSGKNGSFGLGLPFCKRVMSAFGGSIHCVSSFGKWTEFCLLFPPYQSEIIDNIKHEIMRSKSLLYVGDHSLVSRKLNELSFYSGFTLTSLSIQDAIELEEYEFEFDLIIVDLDCCRELEYRQLESKLTFTEAKIAFLFENHKKYHDQFSRYLTFYPVERSALLEDSAGVIEKLVFESPEPDRNVLPRKTNQFGKRVLIADDNDSVRSFTAILLNKQGYQVTEATNGEEVIQALNSTPIDLILMDLEMPIMNGFDTTSRIRCSSQTYSNVPIVGHTGDNREDTLFRIREAGMNDYLIKPTDKNRLLDKLEHYL